MISAYPDRKNASVLWIHPLAGIVRRYSLSSPVSRCSILKLGLLERDYRLNAIFIIINKLVSKGQEDRRSTYYVKGDM